jgi:flavorubredoxin
MDAFGQHYASNDRFDDELDWPAIREQARIYVANILMPYGAAVAKAVAAVRTLSPELIAPSHGIIWRSHVENILDCYSHWSAHKPEKKVLIFYDTMWKSTEMMAQAIYEGACETKGTDVRLYSVHSTHRTRLAAEILDAAAIAVGSPTLNMGMMPSVADVLTYLKGLRPSGKAGFAFGSYGWGRGGPEDVEKVLQEIKVDLLRPFLKIPYRPSAEDLETCRAAGRLLGEKAAKVSC